MALRHIANEIVANNRDKIISEEHNNKSDNDELSTGREWLPLQYDIFTTVYHCRIFDKGYIVKVQWKMM